MDGLTNSPPDRLRRIVEALKSAPIPNLSADDHAFLLIGLQRYLADPKKHPLVHVFQLSPKVGGTPWWREEALQRRNEALWCLHDLVSPGAKPFAAADKILQEIKSVVHRWRGDRHFDPRPNLTASDLACFAVLDVDGEELLTQKQVANILKARR